MPEPQHMIALHKANKVRLARAETKRAILTNDRVLLRVLHDPPDHMLTCSMVELLSSQRRWASTKSRKFLERHHITEHRTLGALTERQREKLAADLEHRRSARGAWNI